MLEFLATSLYAIANEKFFFFLAVRGKEVRELVQAFNDIINYCTIFNMNCFYILVE